MNNNIYKENLYTTFIIIFLALIIGKTSVGGTDNGEFYIIIQRPIVIFLWLGITIFLTYIVEKWN